MAPKEADINTRLILLELSSEQDRENIANLDKRMIAQEKNWRITRGVLNSIANWKAERWISIAITIINLLILLLNRNGET